MAKANHALIIPVTEILDSAIIEPRYSRGPDRRPKPDRRQLDLDFLHAAIRSDNSASQTQTEGQQ
jgi:hypothetical protein